MDPTRLRQAEAIFHQLIELAVEERRRILDEHCRGDEALRSLVVDLLASDAGAMGDFLEVPALGYSLRGRECRGPMPTRVGRYRLLRLIGEGGMGAVYEAAQEQPHRTVALKLVKPGFATDAVRRRFQHEAEILGQLQHPGIACIHEAGLADVEFDGTVTAEQPFFAMELIRGRFLTAYASERRLSTTQRLDLFAAICDAVHHAHQKGVIHRDLKPANILVSDEGEPKVLDFGVARCTNADLQSITLQGGADLLIGTIPYMSPEHVAGNRSELDVRSDIYALGVILNELLTGMLPHDLRDRSIAEAARIIRDEDPIPLGTTNAALRGDLETIVAKALEKDKTRRYQSATELASDVRRFLNDEPICARPVTALYQFRKFVRRNRGVVFAAAAAVVILVAGVIVSSALAIGQLRASRESNRLRRIAEEARDRAQAAAARAEALNDFLSEMLFSADPDNSPNPEVTVREVVDQAARILDAGPLAGRLAITAALRDTLGQVYMALGQYPQAENFLVSSVQSHRELLGGDHPELAAALSHLGALRYKQGRFDEAKDLLRESLAIRESYFGENHPKVATVLHDLSAVYAARRDPNAAEPMMRRALAIRREAHGRDHPDVAASLNSLAVILARLGRTDEAETLYRETLDVHQRVYGDMHPRYAAALNNVARFLQSQGDLDQAESCLRRALEIQRSALGESHPDLAPPLNNLAALLLESGELSEAEPLAREGLTIRRSALEPMHPDIGRSTLLLGLIKLEQGHAVEAEPLLRECWEIRRNTLPVHHHLTAEVANSLGECLTALGRYDEAEVLLVESYPHIVAGRGESHERTAKARSRIIRHFEARGLPDRAEEFRRLADGFDEP